MKIAIVGTGYVGLLLGHVLPKWERMFIVLTWILKRLENLKKGIIPIYEPAWRRWLNATIPPTDFILQPNLKIV